MNNPITIPSAENGSEIEAIQNKAVAEMLTFAIQNPVGFPTTGEWLLQVALERLAKPVAYKPQFGVVVPAPDVTPLQITVDREAFLRPEQIVVHDQKCECYECLADNLDRARVFSSEVIAVADNAAPIYLQEQAWPEAPTVSAFEHACEQTAAETIAAQTVVPAPKPDYEAQKRQAEEIVQQAINSDVTFSKEEIVQAIVEATGLTEREAGIRYNHVLHRRQVAQEVEDKAEGFNFSLKHNLTSKHVADRSVTTLPDAPLPNVAEQEEIVPLPALVANLATFVPENYDTPLTQEQLDARLASGQPYTGLKPGMKAMNQVSAAKQKLKYHHGKQA